MHVTALVRLSAPAAMRCRSACLGRARRGRLQGERAASVAERRGAGGREARGKGGARAAASPPAASRGGGQGRAPGASGLGMGQGAWAGRPAERRAACVGRRQESSPGGVCWGHSFGRGAVGGVRRAVQDVWSAVRTRVGPRVYAGRETGRDWRAQRGGAEVDAVAGARLNAGQSARSRRRAPPFPRGSVCRPAGGGDRGRRPTGRARRGGTPAQGGARSEPGPACVCVSVCVV
jgi:hypothetical protein